MSFNRQTWYPSEQVQSSVLMQQEQDASRSLFQFVADALGSTSAVFTGLTATPGTGLEVIIADGALYQLNQLDPTAWSTLPADTNEWMLQGLLRTAATLSGFTAPTTSGDSIDYLIEAQIQVTDTAAVNLPFTNGATPPVTVYESKSPSRQNVVALQVVAGTAAATGSQVAPSPTSGWVPLWLVTVAYGETQIVSGNIALAANAPQFSGFVHSNPNGETPVYLSSPTPQSGFIDITGTMTSGGVVATTALLGGATATTNFDGTFKNGFAGDYLNLTAIGFTGSKQTTDSLDIAGSIGYTGTHAGTDADPLPVSQLNVTMLGGKVASDYALAGGNYITVYATTPTLATGNAGITGYLEASTFTSTVASGTAPFTVTSTTEVANLNANYLQGYGVGNGTGLIPLSNGALNTNLNAQYLNGIASTGYQLAGNYAEMNVTNTGSFTASSSLSSTGGTSGDQASLGYNSTQSLGMNGGGPLAYVQGVAAPLGLLGSKVLTQGPLYVGGDAANQNVYANDLVPSGLLRAGFASYRVTRGSFFSSNPPIMAPGAGGSDYGVYPSLGGGVSFFTGSGYTEIFTFRMIITTTAAFETYINMRANDAVAVYVNGAQQYSSNGQNAALVVAPISLGVGVNTVDISWSGDGQGQDDHFTMFPWLPFVNGQLASYITSAVHG